MSATSPTNEKIASALERIGELLELQGKNPFRAASYRRAARIIRDSDESIQRLLRKEGTEGLQKIRGIGAKLAGAIQEFVETGRIGLLDRLESEVSPTAQLAQVPGIGQELAERIHAELGIESLEELELAAHDGRLERLHGLGTKRVQGIRDALAGKLSRAAIRRARSRQQAATRPAVELLLKIDAEYRRRAESGELRTIAPRRFNPKGESWLPIMKSQRDGWTFTALFSNTARAHELGTTRDWVVIYYGKAEEEGQCTVVTANRGSLKGKRVVRGRESECRQLAAAGR